MKIKIADFDKINAELQTVNGTANTHTATAYHIRLAAEGMENKLESLGIPKGERSGALGTFRSGEKVPNAYKYTRTINVVTLARGSSGWFFTGATKAQVFPNSAHGARLMMTAAQDAKAVSILRSGYSIIASEVMP